MSSNLALSPSSASSSSSSSSSPSSHLHRRSCLSSPSSPSFLKLGTRSRTPRTILTVRSHASADGTGGSKQSSDPMDGCTVTSSAIDFLTLCHRLKTTKRKGWINHGIKGPESIADHMYRMALMALIAGDLPGVNRERCIKIAIVHDIAEAIVGDITPSDGVPKEEKHRREQAALNEMCKVLGGGMRAEEIKELWAEYENNSSIEANLVKDFDKTKLKSKLIESHGFTTYEMRKLLDPFIRKVEMILQALEYETEHGKVLDEFFLSTAGKFQTEIGRTWAAEVTSRRNMRLSNRFN